jgi:hypothetical protein
MSRLPPFPNLEELQAILRRERAEWALEIAEAIAAGAAWPWRTGLVAQRAQA